MAGHIASLIRKQREMDADTRLTFFFSDLGAQPMGCAKPLQCASMVRSQRSTPAVIPQVPAILSLLLFEARSHYAEPGWLQTHRDLPASAYQVV